MTILRAVCLSMTLVLKESNPLKINGWKEFGGDEGKVEGKEN